MDQLLKLGLDLARDAGAEFAELRFTDRNDKTISVKDGALASHASGSSMGLSARVLFRGRWGFSSAPSGGKAIIKRVVNAAISAASAAPNSSHPVRLSACFPVQGEWSGPCGQDPFAMPDSELVELLMAADAAMNIDGISHRFSELNFRREQKLYVNSEGTKTLQTTTLSGGGITAWGLTQGEVQHRSWPCLGGSFSGGGFEYIRELDLPVNARRVAEEAVALTKSPPCPKGITDLVLLGSPLAMQIQHTCGYAAQLGAPASIDSAKAGSLRIGSPLLSFIADATLPGGPGSFGYDDEGIKAQKFNIIRDGKFINFLSGREQAASIGRFSSGAMRTSSWLLPPAPRMTNIILQPGATSIKTLISGIESGILMDSWRNFSVDPNRQGFFAQAEGGWLIEKGEVKHMVQNPVYTGNSTDFWSSCDAVGSPVDQQILGLMDQRVIVGHGVVPIRVRGVKAGAY